jgi:hypothetical protein
MNLPGGLLGAPGWVANLEGTAYRGPRPGATRYLPARRVILASLRRFPVSHLVQLNYA